MKTYYKFLFLLYLPSVVLFIAYNIYCSLNIRSNDLRYRQVIFISLGAALLLALCITFFTSLRQLKKIIEVTDGI